MTDLCQIRIQTPSATIEFVVTPEGRLLCGEAPGIPTAGNGWVFEPALTVVHSDGNTSTDLRVAGFSAEGDLTKIELEDDAYPFQVSLLFQTYPEDDVIETWTEIRHEETGAVRLDKFASSALHLGNQPFWLTQFRGDWADEVHLSEEKLTYGVKTLDSKLGVRAHQFRAPWFILSGGGPAQEDEGLVIGGSLAWSGSFEFDFEVGPRGETRAICGINPFASTYHLSPGDTFQTPKMVWAWSKSGKGELSRKLHRWVRTRVLRDGDRPRDILLNNWEATYFSFNEAKIVSLLDGAKALGMELFLLDDGWFGRKFPRDDDTQGLGDWMPDAEKLPHGLGILTQAAKERGLRFGIWLEPEMVNPDSELFEAHPDCVIRQPHRELELQRNQLILDLTRPEAKEFAFQVADRTLRENPGISYVKWDCNRYVTQPGSPYLPADRQSHLWIEYVRALYEIFARLAEAHPSVELMMCSGGGGRVDYGAMKFAHEYWPSDMTDPARRVFIQWGYSHFFPAIASAAHVTELGNRPLKFAFDVAMSGRLGMDMDVDKLSDADRAYAASAVAAYKEIRGVVQFGDLYRLESPYDGPRSTLQYVLGDSAVVFVYSLGNSPALALDLKGLGAGQYRVSEVLGVFEAEIVGGGAVLLPALGAYESMVLRVDRL